jgi:hypothetical protein
MALLSASTVSGSGVTSGIRSCSIDGGDEGLRVTSGIRNYVVDGGLRREHWAPMRAGG